MSRVLAALCILLTTAAYHHAAQVSMLKRSQYKQFRTKWTEVSSNDLPRFGVTSRVSINPVHPAHSVTDEEPYKIAFSFADERHVTSWLAVNDGRGHVLSYIAFQFTYSGDYIKSMTWSTHYQEGDKAVKAPEKIHLVYYWTEEKDSDEHSAFALLLLVGSVVTWISAFLAVTGWERRHVPSSTSRLPSTTTHALGLGSATHAD